MLLTLEPHNRDQAAAMLADGGWVVACLCAAWCDVCSGFRAGFEELALRRPDQRFLWIDIEDQADVVGDLDVENFPTLLIQRREVVAFFGPVQPDQRLAERLLLAQIEKSDGELQAEANSSVERRTWQRECDLRRRLLDANRE